MRDRAFVADLLRKGTAPEVIRDRLEGRGLTPEAAARMVEEQRQFGAARLAGDLLSRGLPPEAVRAQIVQTGFDEASAAAILEKVVHRRWRGRAANTVRAVLMIALTIGGGLMLVAGILLRLAIRAGLMPTMVFPATLLILVGVLLLTVAGLLG